MKIVDIFWGGVYLFLIELRKILSQNGNNKNVFNKLSYICGKVLARKFGKITKNS
jgi:hypothetical protein